MGGVKVWFWRFRKRYGMKEYYPDIRAILRDIRRLYGRVFNTSIDRSYISLSRSSYIYRRLLAGVHIDPRHKCGKKGKVLCYKKTPTGFHYSSTHEKSFFFSGANCNYCTDDLRKSKPTEDIYWEV
jgi:hypothetical protein